MKVILKEDIHNLGDSGDLVTVKPGYARNYLIPNGLAVTATPAARKQYAETVKQREHKEAKLREEATLLAQKMEGIRLSVGAKTSSSGRIFGSVNTLQIAEALEAKGFEVDRKRIIIQGAVKEIGEYKALVKLYRGVSVEIDFDVVAE